MASTDFYTVDGSMSQSYVGIVNKAMGLLNASMAIKLAQDLENRYKAKDFAVLAENALAEQMRYEKNDSYPLSFVLTQMRLIKEGSYEKIDFEKSKRLAEELSGKAALELNLNRSKKSDNILKGVSDLYRDM